MFNNKTREKNIARISIVSAFGSCANMIIQFMYRTFFLYILTVEYLGIEGLFSNVIQVLSLADLGIGITIAYKLYEPIKDNSIEQVAALMHFYKKLYTIIAGVVLTVGVLIIPFLSFFVKDSNEIPDDINLCLVYLLFLGQSISSYFFSYKQTLLTADQKGDIVILFNLLSLFIKTVFQLIILEITKNYQIMLASAIIITIVLNWGFGIFITRKYREIFKTHVKISTKTKQEFIKERRLCCFIELEVLF